MMTTKVRIRKTKEGNVVLLSGLCVTGMLPVDRLRYRLLPMLFEGPESLNYSYTKARAESVLKSNIAHLVNKLRNSDVDYSVQNISQLDHVLRRMNSVQAYTSLLLENPV
jgi:hypothetical protein